MHNWPTTLLWPAPSTRVLLLSGLWEAGQWSAVLSVWASLTKTSSWDIFPHKIRYSLLLTLGELVILNPCFLVRNLAMWLALSYLTSEWMRLAQTQVSRYLDSFFPFLSALFPHSWLVMIQKTECRHAVPNVFRDSSKWEQAPTCLGRPFLSHPWLNCLGQVYF